jgi:hypothetical protein
MASRENISGAIECMDAKVNLAIVAARRFCEKSWLAAAAIFVPNASRRRVAENAHHFAGRDETHEACARV